MLSEISQVPKNKYCIILLHWRTQSSSTCRDKKQYGREKEELWRALDTCSSDDCTRWNALDEMHWMLPNRTLQNSTAPFILFTCCCDERDGIKTEHWEGEETVGRIKITITLRPKLSSFSHLLMLCVESHQEATLIFCENKMVLLPRQHVSELAGEYQAVWLSFWQYSHKACCWTPREWLYYTHYLEITVLPGNLTRHTQRTIEGRQAQGCQSRVRHMRCCGTAEMQECNYLWRSFFTRVPSGTKLCSVIRLTLFIPHVSTFISHALPVVFRNSLRRYF